MEDDIHSRRKRKAGTSLSERSPCFMYIQILEKWRKRIMNTKQIAFIICANNAQYYNECVRYIQDLEVPEKYSTDIICIQEADSMAQGYNAGMSATDAKYKVYLHQDTFILNKRLIYDILEIFELDETIGMIGVIGSQSLPADANCYLGWNVGRICAFDGFCAFEAELMQDSEIKYIPVNAVDGLMMITQYDVPWREDFLDGWDFYDVSQSLEMIRRGFQVVVPFQKIAWCYHDCGVSNLKNYDLYRQKMIREYPEIFTGIVDGIECTERQYRAEKAEEVRRILITLLEKGAYKELNDNIEKVRAMALADNQVREIMNIMEIYSIEENSGMGIHSEWIQLRNWEEVHAYYSWVRWVLLRIEYKRKDERIAELEEKIKSGKISCEAMHKIFHITIPDRNGE